VREVVRRDDLFDAPQELVRHVRWNQFVVLIGPHITNAAIRPVPEPIRVGKSDHQIVGNMIILVVDVIFRR
jgi:hypothetical protein